MQVVLQMLRNGTLGAEINEVINDTTEEPPVDNDTTTEPPVDNDTTTEPPVDNDTETENNETNNENNVTPTNWFEEVARGLGFQQI